MVWSFAKKFHIVEVYDNQRPWLRPRCWSGSCLFSKRRLAPQVCYSKSQNIERNLFHQGWSVEWFIEENSGEDVWRMRLVEYIGVKFGALFGVYITLIKNLDIL